MKALAGRPLGHLWRALAVGFGLFLLLFAYWSVFDLWKLALEPGAPLGLARYGRIQLTLTALLAFLLVTPRWVARRAVEEFGALEPWTGVSAAEIARTTEQQSVLSTALSATFAGLGLVLGIGLIVATSQRPALFLTPEVWGADVGWAVFANTLIFYLMLAAAWRGARAQDVLERVVRGADRVDLLDPAPLTVFAHHGLRVAFVWIGGSSIASLLVLGLDRIGPLFAVLALTLTAGALAFLGPVRLVRRRLRAEKAAELARVRGEIARARDAALARDVQQASLLPGLLAYEARVAAIAEWPFDVPTLLRLAALGLLASGSWLGGALVERLLGVVLD